MMLRSGFVRRAAAAPALRRSWRRRREALARAFSSPSSTSSSWVVSCDWLAAQLDTQPDTARPVVVDATWFLPGSDFHVQAQAQHGDDVTARDLFNARHIPGAAFLDLDGLSDANFCPTGHNLPTPESFTAECRRLGLLRQPTPPTVVVYDQLGLFSAPRGLFTFRAFGFDDVFVLEGGLPAWTHLGFPTTATTTSEASEVSAKAAADAANSSGAGEPVGGGDAALLRKRPDVQWTLSDVERNRAARDAAARVQVVDARSRGRFLGTEPEPRAGLRGGHIPHSVSVPFPDVLQPYEALGGASALKPASELRSLFAERGVRLDKPAALTCGSGMTAAILSLALHEAGHAQGRPIFEGSWSEWGARDDTEVWTAEDLEAQDP